MHYKWMIALMAAWVGGLSETEAQAPGNYAHGELLYQTHCIGCHSSQMHWRDKKTVKDWPSLKAEVNRWQKEAKLGWSDEDIADVARYLNALHYLFPSPNLATLQLPASSMSETAKAAKSEP
jgi:mono/diheme cytochrome c family protein